MMEERQWRLGTLLGNNSWMQTTVSPIITIQISAKTRSGTGNGMLYSEEGGGVGRGKGFRDSFAHPV